LVHEPTGLGDSTWLAGFRLVDVDSTTTSGDSPFRSRRVYQGVGYANSAHSRGDAVFAEESAESVSPFNGAHGRGRDPRLLGQGIGRLEIE
jgi:hypothetical protein